MVKRASKGANTDISTPPSRRDKSHRRNPRACEACRARKRKCGGEQPCKQCRSSSQSCVYRTTKTTVNPTRQIRLLEHQLREATSFLHVLNERLPDDGNVDIKPVLDSLHSLSQPRSTSSASAGLEDGHSTAVQLSSMLAGCGRIISLNPGRTSFYGALSEVSFILRVLELFDRGAYSPENTIGPLTDMFDRPLPAIKEPSPLFPAMDSTISNTITTTKARAVELTEFLIYSPQTFTDFLNRNAVLQIVEAIHGPKDGVETAISASDTALYHSIMAFGQLTACSLEQHTSCSEHVQIAWQHLLQSCEVLESYAHPDSNSIQALLCNIHFLISNCRMVKAHALLSIAYSNITRLGLHRKLISDQESASSATKQEIAAVSMVIKFDLYLSLFLDLPRFVSDDLVVACLHNLEVLAQNENVVMALAGVKHLELLHFTCTARQSVFGRSTDGLDANTVDWAKLEDIERDLLRWSSDLSSIVAQLGNGPDTAVLRTELEFASYFAQLSLFRPFLHYLIHMAQGKPLPPSQSKHALACIKIASTTILRAETLFHQHHQLPPTWTTTYTLFLAVMCLVFLISAHDGTAQPGEAWRRAVTGLRTLEASKSITNCAEQGMRVVEMVVGQLSHTVDFDFRDIEREAALLRTQQQGEMSVDAAVVLSPLPTSLPLPPSRVEDFGDTTLLPMEEMEEMDYYFNADTMLARAEVLPLGFGFVDLLNAELEEDGLDID